MHLAQIHFGKLKEKLEKYPNDTSFFYSFRTSDFTDLETDVKNYLKILDEHLPLWIISVEPVEEDLFNVKGRLKINSPYKELNVMDELSKVLTQDRVEYHLENIKYIREKYYHSRLISFDEAGKEGFLNPDDKDDERLYKYRMKFECHEMFCGSTVTRFVEYLFNF